MRFATLSTIIITATAATASTDGSDSVARGLRHRNFAQDIRDSFKRASAPPTLKKKTVKRDGDTNLVRRCKLRPTNSTLVQDSPTADDPFPTSSSMTGNHPAPSDTPPNDDVGASPPPTDGLPESIWKLQRVHEGSSFFDKWDFWSYNDPTHGTVDYQTRESAQNLGLISVNGAGNAIMRVDTTPQVSGNRRSVRVHDHGFPFDGGLVIFDSVHMPTGCGTWPAFWMNGPNWPEGGEIDIVEGVHEDTVNQASIHTGSGCHISADTSPARGELHGGTNCASYESANSGCGFRDTVPNTFGAPFNNAGGGVYAMQWDENGIKVFFWGRNDIPSDITAGKPQPDTWRSPVGSWGASRCDPFRFFYRNFVIINITMCGDWAGSQGSWERTGCRAKTGYDTCQAFVRENGGAFNDAYWEIKSVKVYQK